MVRKKIADSPASFNVGERIKDVLKERRCTVTWLAEQVPCDRSNIYNIFRRNDISTGLLRRIAAILNYDFFKDISESLNKTGKRTKLGGGKSHTQKTASNT